MTTATPAPTAAPSFLKKAETWTLEEFRTAITALMVAKNAISKELAAVEGWTLEKTNAFNAMLHHLYTTPVFMQDVSKVIDLPKDLLADPVWQKIQSGFEGVFAEVKAEAVKVEDFFTGATPAPTPSPTVAPVAKTELKTTAPTPTLAPTPAPTSALQGDVKKIEDDVKADVSNIVTDAKADLKKVETAAEGELKKVETAAEGELDKVKTAIGNEAKKLEGEAITAAENAVNKATGTTPVTGKLTADNEFVIKS